MERRIDWRAPLQAGTTLRCGEASPQLATHISFKRGWMFGSQEFKERILQFAEKQLTEGTKRRADGYTGAELKDHGEALAMRIFNSGLIYFNVSSDCLRGAAKSDWRKAIIGELIQRNTTIELD